MRGAQVSCFSREGALISFLQPKGAIWESEWDRVFFCRGQGPISCALAFMKHVN